MITRNGFLFDMEAPAGQQVRCIASKATAPLPILIPQIIEVNRTGRSLTTLVDNFTAFIGSGGIMEMTLLIQIRAEQ
jgi:hypothetical protein